MTLQLRNLILILILIGTSFAVNLGQASSAGPAAQKRVEVVEYEALNAGTGAGPAGPIVAEAKIEPRGARFLAIEIADSSGSAVLAKIIQDSEVTALCTATPKPVMIRPDFPVTVRMYAGRCYDGTPSVVTSGTVTAKLTTASPGGPRSESRPYSVTAPEVIGKDGNAAYVTAVTYMVGPREHRLQLSLEDASGVAVFAKVEYGIGGFPTEAGVPVCGASKRPISVTPGTPVTVFIYAGGCPGGTPGAPTFGQVDATFSKR